MKVEIENVMSVASGAVDINEGEVTAILAHNMRGKTSAAVALGAVLACDANPLGVPATARTQYVRDGQDSASVRVWEGETEMVEWSPRSGEMTYDGAWRACTRAAAGLVDFATISPAERVRVWEGMFLPEESVVIKRLREELSKHLDNREVEGVIDTIQAHDWKGVDRIYGDRARGEKREWTRITGETYGVAKAADWHPDGWLSSDDGVSLGQAKADFDGASLALHGLQVANAITQAERERGVKAKDMYPAAIEAEEAAKATYNELKDRWNKASHAVRQLKSTGRALRAQAVAHEKNEPGTIRTLTCPKCEAALVMGPNRKLLPHDPSTESEEHLEWQKVRDDIKDRLSETSSLLKAATETMEGLRGPLDEAKDELQPAQVAVAMIERDLEFLEKPIEDQEQIDAFEKQKSLVEDNRQRVARITDFLKAREHHTNVQAYTLIAQLLGPKGVRAESMTKAMQKLDEFLEIVAKLTGWPRVRVSKDYSVSIGDRGILKMCSESERWRAQVSLQVAVARMMRDRVIVIDRADVLDDEARLELRTMIQALQGRSGAPAIVIMATELDDSPTWLADTKASIYRIDEHHRLISQNV